MEENSKKEILNNLEKLHDMVEDNDPNNQDQAVSEIMEEKVSDLYNELQENKFDIEAANMSMIDKGQDHVISTGRQMMNLVSNFEYFVLLSFF